MINGDKIICSQGGEDRTATLLRMLESYPRNFIDLSSFYETPNGKPIFIKGEAVCNISEINEKEVLVE